MNYYKISLLQPSKHIDRLYSYSFKNKIDIGKIVLVPFGRGNKLICGIIIGEDENPENLDKIKEIIRIKDEEYSLSKSEINLALYTKDEYMCSYYEALRLFTAPGGYDKDAENYSLTYTLKDKKSLEELIHSTRKNAINKLEFLNLLNEIGKADEEFIKNIIPFPFKKYVKELIEKDIISYEKKAVYPGEEKNPTAPAKPIKLNNEQEKVYEKIINCYELGTPKPVLLHGITGSGKTAIYIQLIRKLLQNGKSSIVLVPEISLTPQTIERFSSSFPGQIAVIHSNLTKRERYNQWLMAKNGKAKIIIGVRSALFTPVQNLGAIIIDECHDEAYYSEMSPKYDTIQLAEKFCNEYKSLLLLGSATPTIAQYFRAKNDELVLLELKNRANGKPLPVVETVDMTKEIKTGNRSLLSKKLQIEMRQALAKGEQVILFLNRRGFSNFLTCNNCGYVPKCEHCDITLTYHKYDNTFRCHYCGHAEKAYNSCPDCDDGVLTDLGSGTQKIELQAREIFEKAKIFRLDKDTAAQSGSYEEILNEFKNTKSAILVGTQMIGKGHDFPLVSLVGIINADQGSFSPDYRAAERSFNLIEQVGGRAGRDKIRGKVILQTYSSSNPLSYFIRNHSYEEFYEYEIKNRERFNYEPFGNIIKITISSKSEQDAKSSGQKLFDALEFYNKQNFANSLKIFDPAPAMIGKIEDKFRYAIVVRIKNEDLKRAKTMIYYCLSEKRSIVLDTGVSVSVDVNPSSML